MTKIAALDDVRLAHLARRDQKTADSILTRLHPRVWQVVRMVRGPRQDADELLQRCFVEILESLHKFRGEGSLESWAGQVAYRVVMRHVKTTRINEINETPTSEEMGISKRNPETEVSRMTVWERLMAEMQKIPAKRRLTLMLHLVYEHTVEEVAELTGVSVNTTKYRLRTGYRELRVIFSRNADLKEAMLEAIDG
ncbi:MAG: sigma-70 family RNA polymerase sigma factor [Proteobacteria bacterium]|nr:sigma-70 family RNA polymerase sigma factor [Pseudomonadota bacterium]